MNQKIINALVHMYECAVILRSCSPVEDDFSELMHKFDSAVTAVYYAAEGEKFGFTPSSFERKRDVFDKLKIESHLTFDALTKANLARVPVFKNASGKITHENTDGSDWLISEWTNAVAGEVGEACNLAKKIRRGDFESDKLRVAYKELAKEMADVITYADIVIYRCGFVTSNVVREKFNDVSDRVGCSIKL